MKNNLLHLAVLIVVALGTVGEIPSAQSQPVEPPPKDAAGFSLAAPGHPFEFPRDHGAHPDYRIEWWYLTGHFDAAEPDRRFGFQATFFRIGQTPGESLAPDADTLFGTNQLYLAHMALLDVETGTFIHEERFQRENWDAHAAVGDLDVRNGNWSLKRIGDEEFRLRGGVLSEALFDFELKPTKPRVIFGENGVSRKGADPAAASLYITHPRLALSGELRWKQQTFEVTGTAWMDHEISSSQLTADQVGWDWASIQLNDGREIMVYQMRLADGSTDPYSRLYWIDRDSTLTSRTPDEFTWRGQKQWTSPHSDATYPIDLLLTAMDPEDNRARTLRLRPLVDDQEIVGKLGGVNYWEGACDVLDENNQIIGRAYVELTGYDGSLQGRL